MAVVTNYDTEFKQLLEDVGDWMAENIEEIEAEGPGRYALVEFSTHYPWFSTHPSVDAAIDYHVEQDSAHDWWGPKTFLQDLKTGERWFVDVATYAYGTDEKGAEVKVEVPEIAYPHDIQVAGRTRRMYQ